MGIMSWRRGSPKGALRSCSTRKGVDTGQPTAATNADLQGQVTGPVHLKLADASASSGARVKRQVLSRQLGVERGAILFLISSQAVLLASGPYFECHGIKPQEPGSDKHLLP